MLCDEDYVPCILTKVCLPPSCKAKIALLTIRIIPDLSTTYLFFVYIQVPEAFQELALIVMAYG
jgi:hypothetical protein